MNIKAVSVIALATAAIGYCTYRQYRKFKQEEILTPEQKVEVQRILDPVPEIVKPSR